MSMRATMAAGLFLLAALPAPAQTALEWKFKEGDKFYVEVVTENKQAVTVGDKTSNSESTYTTVSRFEVKKADSGSYTIEQTIEGVQVKSNKTDDPTVAVVSRFANLLKGATFKFTLSSSGKISGNLEGYDDLIKKLSGGNEKAEKGNRALLPEDAFKDELAAVFGFLPDKPVASGATWTRDESMALPWGKLSGKATYTYDGKDKDGEKISIERRLSYAVPEGEGAAGVKVTKGDVKVEGAGGTVIADPAAGRLVSATQKMHVSGTITVTDTSTKDTTAAKPTTFTVDQTTTRTIRRVDKNPLEK
jgi:hypothetical protein